MFNYILNEDNIITILQDNKVDLGLGTINDNMDGSEYWKAAEYPKAVVESSGGEVLLYRNIREKLENTTVFNQRSKTSDIYILYRKERSWPLAKAGCLQIAEKITELLAKELQLGFNKKLKIAYKTGSDMINGVPSYVVRLQVTVEQEK